MSPRYRLVRASIAMILAIGLSGSLVWTQIANRAFDQAATVWAAIIFAIGCWRARYWLTRATVRRFESEVIVLTVKERVRKAWLMWLLGFGGALLIWTIQYLENDLQQYWKNGLPFVVLGFVGVFVFVFARKERRLTHAANRIKEDMEARHAQMHPPLADVVATQVSRVADIPIVRYPLSIVLFWFAFYVSQEWTQRNSWLVVMASICGALWCARELAIWLIGAGIFFGLAWAFFSGISMLPVSAAIVIGALIIASALER